MDRFYLLAPAMSLLATFGLAFAVYCARCAAGRPPVVHHVKHNQLFGPFLARFLVWLIGPLERLLLGRVSPNAITLASLLLCGVTGAAVALGPDDRTAVVAGMGAGWRIGRGVTVASEPPGLSRRY